MKLPVTLLALLLALGAGGRPNAQDVVATRDVAAARAYVDALAGDGTRSGVVLVAVDGEVVLRRAHGMADVELGVPMVPEHVFRLGSLTKPVTASAVLAAVEAGRLSLDTRICGLLERCLSSWREVTIRHLLSHTSGVTDHFGDLDAVPVEETVAELVRMVAALPADEPLESPVGSEYAYSNFNYVLLGAALETAYGTTWEAVLNGTLFEPLGLSSMGYDDVYEILPLRVRGYDRDEDGELRNIDYDDHAAYAAGGLRSDIDDLYRWLDAYLGGAVVSPSLIAESLTPVQGTYGYGWQVREFFGHRVYNHTGGIDGFSSHFAHYPDDGVTIVVLSNVESDSAILRACDLAAAIFGRRGAAASLHDEIEPRVRCGVAG